MVSWMAWSYQEEYFPLETVRVPSASITLSPSVTWKDLVMAQKDLSMQTILEYELATGGFRHRY